MVIHNHKTNLTVYPNFDSGEYMGTFTVLHDELRYAPADDIKFLNVQIVIASALKKLFDKKDKKMK